MELSRGAVATMAVAVGVVAGGLAYLIGTRMGRRRRRLEPSGEVSKSRVEAARVRADLMPAISRVLQGTSVWDQLQLEIVRAGLLLRPSELVGFMLFSGLVGAGLGLLLNRGHATTVILTLAFASAPWAWLKVRQNKRQAELISQLPDALDMLSSALRSGFSFLRGVQLIASQMQPPISEEFSRLAREIRMGLSTEEALDNLVLRADCYDLELIVAAVQIQLRVGGNLSEILDNIAETIRERVRLQDEISAATAEARLSATILLLMPFAMGFIINTLNPHYLAPLFTNPMGIAMLLGAGILLGLGALVIRKMVQVDL